MGCQLGKLAASERRGNNAGPVTDGPPPATDPRLPLTAKQKYSMLASWKGISRAMEKTGICMFIKLFEENQDLLDMFEKFRQCKTKEEQINSMELAEHANNVMNTLDEGIKGLDDLDNFFQYIHQVGASHRKIPGFRVEYFWKIEAPFLAAVESTLGDRYTPNVENIYKITIKFILETLIEGYEKAGNNPSSAS
ncbi:neuroglobin-like [Bombyx mandarina]|uniref:Globin domain-containing protein n=2 Tax=Bombyx TaxID=7090 RepID=A0A8R1WK06_BOMMO|nr:neuroglobin [Bombyx mori]XP_021204084.1 neuroglobin [Bombyx mori]XP_028028977.1 neuroglobin-like [Bombyx mandarina]